MTASQSLAVTLCTADAPEQAFYFLFFYFWQCSTAEKTSLDAQPQDTYVSNRVIWLHTSYHSRDL